MTQLESTIALRADVEELVRRHVRLAATADDLATARLADLGLDSMSAIELVLDIEDTLGVVFPDELLVIETFQTALTLQAVVTRLEGGGT